MANQTGVNQFGSAVVQPKYGDVGKETALTKSAPMSGAPRAATAFNLPRRAAKAVVRGGGGGAAPRGGVASVAPPLMTPQQPGPSPISLRAIASVPGVSPLVQAIFGNA